ncbi:hypothetical protein BG011_003859 [Mortierella polycephala]|uniref:Cyclin N-terminal domain-containing protein n=1 Tax=Mortierella polycephala TaxID=41804 RepID=A0A9P6Q3E5_9FUNG|nr:hypothetical protein BG011_003859 [Mortierella polycephala]
MTIQDDGMRDNGSESHLTSQKTASQSLLKIQFPNLTLTLALIYVDRLKAKYPEAKGEPGCSHRLFLVAFIIATKYRYSVELSRPLLQDCNGEILSEDSEQDEYNDRIGTNFTSTTTPERTLEARLNAELIFSNHAWVRLLNLGSFYRQPPPSTTSSISTSISTSTPTSTQSSESIHPSPPAPSQALPSTPRSPTSSASPTSPISPRSPQTNPTAQPQLPSFASIIHSTSSTPSILQVEDLDRMEAEFLTFLDLDLATMSHDLETCWNLLVGKAEASS